MMTPGPWELDSANDPRTQLETLLERRDLAAYRAVSSIRVVLDFFEAQDFASAENMLSKALAEFRQADERVNQFRERLSQAKLTQSTQGEKPANGHTNRNSAA